MGGRFCRLDQTLVEIMQIFSRNRVKRPPPPKKVFTAIWDYSRPEFVEFICVGWLFFVDHRALKSRMVDVYISMENAKSRWGGRQLSMGGRIPPCPLYNLSTDFTTTSTVRSVVSEMQTSLRFKKRVPYFFAKIVAYRTVLWYSSELPNRMFHRFFVLFFSVWVCDQIHKITLF